MNRHRLLISVLAATIALASRRSSACAAPAGVPALASRRALADDWPADGRRVMSLSTPVGHQPSLWVLDGGPDRLLVVGESPLCVSANPWNRSGVAAGIVARNGDLIAGDGTESLLTCEQEYRYNPSTQLWPFATTDDSGNLFVMYKIVGMHQSNDFWLETLGPGGGVRTHVGHYDDFHFALTYMTPARGGFVYTLGFEGGSPTGPLYLQAFRHTAPASPRVLVDPIESAYRSALCSDGRGNAIVAWFEESTGPNDSSHVQLYDHDGRTLWVAGDERLRGDVQAMQADSAGGVYVTLADPSDGKTRLHRLDSDGREHAGWRAEGMVTLTSPCIVLALVADGMNGVFLVSYCSSDGYPRLYRVLATGQMAPGWSASGIPVWGETYPDGYIGGLCPDGHGGIYNVWSENRGTGSGVDAYVRHVLSDGSLVGSATGTLFVGANGDQVVTSLLSDGAGGLYAAWTDNRDSTLQAYVGHLPMDVQTGIALSLVRVEAIGRAVEVSWAASDRNFSGEAWRRMNEGPWLPLRPVAADGSGLVLLRDSDVRAGNRYCYRLADASGAVNAATEACAMVGAQTASPLALGPSPTHGHLEWRLSGESSAPVDLEVLDLAGRSVMRAQLAPAQVGAVDLPSDLQAGVYLVSLRQGGHEYRARAVLVR